MTDKSGIQTNPKIRATLDLLERGEKEINLSDKYKNIILVLGNTGSGKSTFTQWIAGYGDKLIAVEVEKDSGEFIIQDSTRISNSTLRSQTIFPELVIDEKMDSAYYDCPGFHDTRSTSTEIATTYFIKKVLDHAKSIKIIFTISYPSVRKGVDRQDFMELVRHATELIKNIQKFEKSIAVVVTKVDNQYINQGRVLVSDDKVISAISSFLREAKQYLEEKLKLSDNPKKEKRLYEEGIKFIDVLLAKDGVHYSKIGIFRRPDMAGPLTNITLLESGKKEIESIIYKKLNFTETNVNDFGFTISADSRLEINDLVTEINSNIWSNVSKILDKVHEYYRNLLENIDSVVYSFVSRDNAILYVNQTKAQTFSYKINEEFNVTLSFLENIQNVTDIQTLAEKVKKLTNYLALNTTESTSSSIEIQGKFFNFLQVVTGEPLQTMPWTVLFNKSLTLLHQMKSKMTRDINDIAEIINRYLTEAITEIHEHYNNKIKESGIEKLPAELLKEGDVMYNIERGIKNATTIRELEKVAKLIYNVSSRRGFKVVKNNVQIILNQQNYAKFLQTLSDNKLEEGRPPFTSPFEDASTFLRMSEKWYTYLNCMYSKLSEYQIQENVRKYDVSDVEDWGQLGKPQGITINKFNFNAFINKTKQFCEYSTIDSKKISSLQLVELNSILNITLKHRPDVNCQGPQMFIKGDYIRIKDVVTYLNEIVNGHAENKCRDFINNKQEKTVNIFALNALFIDEDLSLIRLMNLTNQPILTIISPTWEIKGSRKVEMDGLDGVRDLTRPPDAWRGSNGTDGKPGQPGGPGGVFFGLGRKFVHGENLTITANGGAGGRGQDGGNGCVGIDGEDAVLPSNDEDCSNLCKSGRTRSGFNCNQIGRSRFYHYSTPTGIYWRDSEECKFQISGKIATAGGDAGNGGSGGLGGNPGTIYLLELNKNSEISKVSNRGRKGKDGKGGNGGIGGKYGDSIITDGRVDVTSRTIDRHWSIAERIQNDKRNSSGKPGIDGANSENMENPKTREVIEPALIINKYKCYLRENLKDRVKNTSLLEFLNNIENNGNVTKIYNPLAFLEDLQGLEEQFPILSQDVDFLPFYESLLSKISVYAQKNNNTIQLRKVLTYLYTATLGKIHLLKENLESNLIINIKEYLDSVHEDIENLKNINNIKTKSDTIYKYKDEYKQEIDKKIEEAADFIAKEITPEINNIDEEIYNKIDALLEEVIDLEKREREVIEELYVKKTQLEDALTLQFIFAPFKLVGEVLNTFGFIGELAGKTVEFGSSIAESMVLDNSSSGYPSLNLPVSVSDLESVKNQIKRNQRNSDLIKKELNELSQEMKNYRGQDDLQIKIIDNAKEKLNNIEAKNFNFNKVEEFLNELVKDVEDAEKNIIPDSKSKEKFKKFLGEIKNKSKKVIQISQIGVELYNKYKENQSVLDEINEAIQREKDKFKMLKEYEEAIYDIITPTLQSVMSNVDEVINNLKNKSKVAIEVTKWKVQSMLRDTKLKMEELTEGFKIKDNLVRCINKLEESMVTLMNVYDHIENYQDTQRFANFMADISSAAARNIQIGDNTLNNAVNSLDVAITSNIVLQRYRVAIDAFKQFVFPLAHIYFDGLTLPSQLTLTDGKNMTSLETLSSEAVRQIEQIKTKLERYRLSLTKEDEYIGSGEFSSRFVSTQPFFIWKNEYNKDVISNLLRGKEVILKADIMHSSTSQDAIKFNVVQLDFRSANESNQPIINSILAGFNISMVHLGDSYYRCNNKIYLIRTNSRGLWYYFEKNKDDDPVHKSDTYNKLKQGDFMLSPYALWKIKLYNITNKNNYSYEDLEQYKDEISLELGGYGRYVNKGAFDDRMMEKYYKEYHEQDTIDVYYNEDLNTELALQDGNLEVKLESESTDDQKWEDKSSRIPSPISTLYTWLKCSFKNLSSKRFYTSPYSASGKLIHHAKNDANSNIVKESDFINEQLIDKNEGVINESFQDSKITDEMELKVKTDHLTGEKSLGEKQVFPDNSPRVICNDCPKLSSTPEDRTQSIDISEGFGTLMLADLFTRLFTGEKYKQTLVVTPTLERELEIHEKWEAVNKGLLKMEALYGENNEQH